MAAGFPTRMAKVDNDPVALCIRRSVYGQKNGVGFYAYSKDAKGKPKKDLRCSSAELLAKAGAPGVEFLAGRYYCPSLWCQ